MGWLAATCILWIFAFIHVPSSSPDWVRRAQVACFGTDQSGLPDTSGWIILTLAPLAMLASIFVALGKEARNGLRYLGGSTSGKSFFVILVALVLVETFWVAERIRRGFEIRRSYVQVDDAETLPKDYPRLNRPAPDFNLVDQHGNQANLGRFGGAPFILTFAFAHCRTVCPLIIKNSQAALSRPQHSDTHLVVVTLDPWRDTPASLATQADDWKFGPAQLFLSGSEQDVNKALERYEVPRQRDERTGDVVHPALVYLIDSGGKIAYAFNNPSPDWISEGLSRLKPEPGSR